MNKPVKIVAGSGGYGGPLVVQATETCNKILCMTAIGGIHPLAAKLAEMTGGEAVDGHKNNVPDEEILVAIVDCGGTLRCGIYPQKGIFTVNLNPVGQSGPLAKYITPDIYVSAVNESCLSYADGEAATEKKAPEEEKDSSRDMKQEQTAERPGLITRLGIGVGQVVGKFFAAGRETIEMVVKNILPFMAFTSTILGIITATGLGNVIAKTISPLCATLPGMLIISLICAMPFLSPVLGPGAVIAQVVGTLLGSQIAMGKIPAQYALPALFAINAQVGCDFIPVGLSLAECESETIELGVPSVLYSRVITGPLAVIIAFAASFGLYHSYIISILNIDFA